MNKKIRAKSQSRVSVKCPECGHAFLPKPDEVQSRAGASSRRKGANFERNIAKKLKKWWPGNHDFKRTPQSGGSALKEGWGLAGDVATTAPDFRFHIECKNAPGSFKGLHNLFSSASALWKWWGQAENECPNDKTPLLIVNRFDQSTWCMSTNTWYQLDEVLDRAHIPFLRFWGLDSNGMILYVWKLDDMLESDPGVWK
jgi:hypothetical protein